MDQSVYVRQAIKGLVQEGVLGAVLLLAGHPALPRPVADDGDRRDDASRSRSWRAIACLYATGNTINVMTLAGLALAIGPLVDSAMICLENTAPAPRPGGGPEEAAFLGASEVALARAGLDPLHVPGACAAGVHAGAGAVPVPADGAWPWRSR